MASSTRGKALFQLGFCLLLVMDMLVWSTTWNAPASNEGQFEQLGDRSPPFLVGTGDSQSGDIPFASGETWPFLILSLSPAVVGSTGPAVAHRIRVASYPVLPQAPPILT